MLRVYIRDGWPHGCGDRDELVPRLWAGCSQRRQHPEEPCLSFGCSPWQCHRGECCWPEMGEKSTFWCFHREEAGNALRLWDSCFSPGLVCCGSKQCWKRKVLSVHFLISIYISLTSNSQKWGKCRKFRKGLFNFNSFCIVEKAFRLSSVWPTPALPVVGLI